MLPALPHAGSKMEKRRDEAELRVRGGTADPKNLDQLLAKAWQDALADRGDGVRISEILELSVPKLKDGPAPLHAVVRTAGTFGAEIAIQFAQDFLTAYGDTIATATGAGAGSLTILQIKRLWPIVRRWLAKEHPEAVGQDVIPNG